MSKKGLVISGLVVLILAVYLLLVYSGALFQPREEAPVAAVPAAQGQPAASPTVPPASAVLAAAPAPAAARSIAGPLLRHKTGTQPGQQTRLVTLLRVDYSGDYLLPEGLTFKNVAQVYLDGRPVDGSRVTIISTGDTIDIWDAQLDSTITALVRY